MTTRCFAWQLSFILNWISPLLSFCILFLLALFSHNNFVSGCNGFSFLDAAIASLWEGLSVRLSVRLSVHRLVGPSVRNAFVKIAKSIGKWLFFAYLCTYIACPTIHWSVCPLFWLSVHYSVHLSIHPSIYISVATLQKLQNLMKNSEK